MTHLLWDHALDMPSKSYVCGHCGHPLASAKGWWAHPHGSSNPYAFSYICHLCSRPTYFDATGSQVPGVVFGNPVSDVPDPSIQLLYEEARKTTGVGAYTAAVLCCRKLLMHIAVAKEAKEGDTFAGYVQYLIDNHYVPPDAKEWVDHIRKVGNEATHEIVIKSKDDAEELLSFIEMLLKVIFQFPAAMKKKYPPLTVLTETTP